MIWPDWLWRRSPFVRTLHWSCQDLKNRLFPSRRSSPWLTPMRRSDAIRLIEYHDQASSETFWKRKWYWGYMQDTYAEVTEVTDAVS